MKAILLAAGLGSRLARNLEQPKSTFEVGGVPLLYRTVSMLKDNGIAVSIVVGYKKEYIFDVLKEFDIKYYYNPFYRVTNSMASLWFAREELTDGEDVILANADVFWEQGILDILLNDKHDAVLLGDRSKIDVGDYFFNTDGDRLVAYGKELDISERTCEYVGLAKISAGFVSTFAGNLQTLLDKEQYHLWWENALYEYNKKYPVFIEDVDGKFWGEIDSIQDYNRICTYFSK